MSLWPPQHLHLMGDVFEVMRERPCQADSATCVSEWEHEVYTVKKALWLVKETRKALHTVRMSPFVLNNQGHTHNATFVSIEKKCGWLELELWKVVLFVMSTLKAKSHRHLLSLSLHNRFLSSDFVGTNLVCVMNPDTKRHIPTNTLQILLRPRVSS